MEGRNGRAVPNQFIITDDNGNEFFQSYDSIIARKGVNGVVLDVTCWDYSKTTGRYRNQFLGETKKETERKIADGTHKLEGLN
jgi:hypothetical protein